MSVVPETARARLLGQAVLAATAESAGSFERALDAPERAQGERLAAILTVVRGSRQAAGIAGFERIRTAREFQDAVPMRRADELARDVDNAAGSARNVLSIEPVLRFERSGGSSGPSKLVPHTRALLSEFQAALMPWLHDLARARPRAWEGPGYWSVSPVAQSFATTSSGVPIGGDDRDYFPEPIQRLLGSMFAVPGAVARLPDVASCRYVTLRLLLQCPDLAFVSVWNPSFLTLLVDSLDANAPRLLDDLASGACRPALDGDGLDADRDAHIRQVVDALPLRAEVERARMLRRALDRDRRLAPSVAWPSLALISVWTDAQAARSLPALREHFPSVELQGKGLLATEGVVSIPWNEAPAPVLAVRSHFLEFIEPETRDARPRLAHELEDGRTYEVVISTGAGLLRYRLGDLVQVVGRHRETPCVRFVGRADQVSDLVGEKLSARRVGDALAEVFSVADVRSPRFAMLAPEWSAPPAYHLYIESEAPDHVHDAWAARIESLLCEDFAYSYARSLGQIGPVRALRVLDGGLRYEARCVALGQRAGDVKPTELDVRPGWEPWMVDHVTSNGAPRKASQGERP